MNLTFILIVTNLKSLFKTYKTHAEATMTLQSSDEPTPPGHPPSTSDPIALYVSVDLNTRRDILTSHPDVTGFIFLEEGHLT